MNTIVNKEDLNVNKTTKLGMEVFEVRYGVKVLNTLISYEAAVHKMLCYKQSFEAVLKVAA